MAYKGRNIIIQVVIDNQYVNIAGMLSKSMMVKRDTTILDTDEKTWRWMINCGIVAASISGSMIFLDDASANHLEDLSRSGEVEKMKMLFEDGAPLVGNFMVQSFEYTTQSTTALQASVTLEGSGIFEHPKVPTAELVLDSILPWAIEDTPLRPDDFQVALTTSNFVMDFGAYPSEIQFNLTTTIPGVRTSIESAGAQLLLSPTPPLDEIDEEYIVPGTQLVVLSTVAPSVSIAHINAVAQLVLTATAPDATQSIESASAQLVLSAEAPVVEDSIESASAQLTLSTSTLAMDFEYIVAGSQLAFNTVAIDVTQSIEVPVDQLNVTTSVPGVV